MTSKNLDKIFEPENIAVIGASEKEKSAGLTLMKNLKAKSEDCLYPVNPNRKEVLGIKSYPQVEDIPEPIDLGVIATPASTVPKIVNACGETGIPALVIISSGFGEIRGEGPKLEEKVEEKREEYGTRIIGPNSLGIINPSENLNVSLAGDMPESGEITFLSQSGSLAASTFDWALSAQFGFNCFVSVGNMLDVDFSDLIDYFGRDRETGSILMYIENIGDAGEFMSAARRSARTKPILAVKSGRQKYSGWEKKWYTEALVGSDEVYDAAFKRAGITRVDSIDGLFSCSETLAKQPLPKGSNLAIVTNADGAGSVATDSLLDLGGELADLSESTVKDLKDLLPPYARPDNPVYITTDADSGDYKKSVEMCMEDENVNGTLCVYAPIGAVSPEDAATAISELRDSIKKPLLPCWIGGEKVQKGQKILRQNGFSVQSTPEQSIKSYLYLNRYAENLERLLETPEELPVDLSPPKYNLKAMIRRIARDDREILTEEESKKALRTYGIPSPESHLVNSVEEAKHYAVNIGFPVNLKVNSTEILERREDGIAANLISEDEVEENYNQIMEKFEEKYPSVEFDGVSVQKAMRDRETELVLGSKKDPIFKSFLVFGRGGREVKYFKDLSVGFPPLNQNLAKRLMEETQVFEELKNYENSSEVLRLLEEHLVRISQLIIDFPEIKEIYVNPFAKNEDEFFALDARIVIDKELALEEVEEKEHLVIKPYPREYVEDWKLDDGRPVSLRPIRPEDEPRMFQLFDTFSKETWRYRFFGPMREVTHEDMVRFTNIDYRREMAIIAELNEEEERKMIGVGRLITDPDREGGEFAVVVGDPWQGLGLGEKLTDALIGIAEDRGLEKIWGTILINNKPMINLCKKLGFEIKKEDNDTVRAEIKLK